MRQLRPAFAMFLVLCGCMQEPDYVAGGGQLNEAAAGGMGGTGGMGGMAGASGAGGPPEGCDQQVNYAVARFSLIAANCQYETADTELDALLTELIYTKPAPELTPEQAEQHPDPLCMIFEDVLPQQFRPIRWRFALAEGDVMQENRAVKVICPRYCVAMQTWIDDHRDLVRQCS